MLKLLKNIFSQSPEDKKKSTLKKLNLEYSQLLEAGMQASRNGKLELYGELAAKADKILKEIELIEKNS